MVGKYRPRCVSSIAGPWRCAAGWTASRCWGRIRGSGCSRSASIPDGSSSSATPRRSRSRRAPRRSTGRRSSTGTWFSSTPATSASPTTTRPSSKATAVTTAKDRGGGASGPTPPAPVKPPPGTPPLDRPAELDGYVVLLYSGNFGVAHDHETFVEGYRRHHREGSGRVALWLNATGSKADRVEEILRREGLPVHRGLPVPLAELPRLLVTPDAHLITLRDGFVGYVLPSKVYGCVQSGRGVLYVGSPDSDVHLLCAREAPSGLYWRADTGDPAGVFRALEEIGRLHEPLESVRYGS